MTKSKELKKLEYAYPSSPLASTLNRGESCWVISVGRGVLKYFQGRDRDLAVEEFEKIDAPLDPYSHTRASLARGFKLGGQDNAMPVKQQG